ncbi:hypothetical protein ACFFU9_01345 [Mariniflexile ostreae]|uniref:Arginyl-tRNA synthetase n=1 Tax=Mariniflexile ostreae TaxID=1520892 RepID=A0ABV5F8C4_9FLAO
MLLDITHPNKKQETLINDLVGKKFSFFKILKMKGVASKRIMVKDVSPNLLFVLNSVENVNYANLELRPSGLIIRITKGLKRFAWAIPYYQLVIYNLNGSSIHAQGKFIHFKANTLFKENKSFFNKLLDEKIKYDTNYSFQNVV